jgi:hypothetical protein
VGLGETEPSVYSERGLTVTACGNEVSNVRAEEEDIRSALSLSTVTAADKVSYACIIVLVKVKCKGRFSGCIRHRLCASLLYPHP